MQKAEAKLKEAARKLFAGKKIDFLLGFEKGTLAGRSRPCRISGVGEVEKLVWNSSCSNNLAVYLPEMFRRKPMRPGQQAPPLPKVGIVVKGCDSLSIALLVRENQAPRENLVVIGMPCTGITDPDTGEIEASCMECPQSVVEHADVLIPGESRKQAKEKHASVAEFEKKPLEERWQYFVEQMSKCIRCYACRQACPGCYCKECFAEQTDPKWIGVGNELSDTMLYHLGRMFHQVGRCVGCNACARACPVGVDLRIFTQKLAKDAEEMFDYDIKNVMKEMPLLCKFCESDSDSFATDPEKKD